MFAYCRNNPVRRIDISGTLDYECDEESEDLASGNRNDWAKGGNRNSANNSNSGAQNAPNVRVSNTLSGARNGLGNSSGYGLAPKQGSPGSTYTQYSSDGKYDIVSVTTYGEYGAPSQRIDYQGRDHGVGLPHIHVFSWAVSNDKVCQTGKHVYCMRRT